MTVIGMMVLLAGCAAIEREDAEQTEQTLAAAGFQIKLADTPEKMAHLQTLTQHELVMHPADGAVRYIYADARFCQCLYAGDEQAYDAYQRLVQERRIAEMNEDAAMNWSLWGPWGPYGW
jgi:hypothetical protein